MGEIIDRIVASGKQEESSNRPNRLIEENSNRTDRFMSPHIEPLKFIGNSYIYQFGEYYFYTSQYKNNDHYVQSKYKTMKEEVTQNQECQMSINMWIATKAAAESILNKMIKECNENMDQKKCFKKFGIRLKARDHQYYNQRYNISSGQQISVHHILAVKLFFDNGPLATKIRQTFRLKQNETLHDIKKRHANFVHICRHICETIYLYGNTAQPDMHIYRGVSQNKFEWFNAIFAGPVSTTDDIQQALKFAGTTGSILQLKTAENDQMYIYGGAKFCNLSNFACESEYLMWTPCLSISDIPFSNRDYQYVESYISAMRLFQKITSGHLFNHVEEKQLLNNDIQHKLNVLIKWRITGNDDVLTELVKTEVTQRIKLVKSIPRRRFDESNERFECLDLLSSSDSGTESYTLSKSLSKSLFKEKKFIKTLCGTVFDSLSNKTKLFWRNSAIKLNENLEQSIEMLLAQTKDYRILECKTLNWRVCVDDLENGANLNDNFLAVDNYLSAEIVDVNLLNAFLNCDKIMNCIGEYFNRRYALSCLCDWKSEINDMKYKNELYSDSINPVLVDIVILPTSCRANNKWYDLIIQINNVQEITETITNSLKWSFDVLCDELHICMHFGETDVSSYSERKHTQILSNDEIRHLVKDKKDIVWKIAFRFVHAIDS